MKFKVGDAVFYTVRQETGVIESIGDRIDHEQTYWVQIGGGLWKVREQHLDAAPQPELPTVA
jgi:hypothetical protein